MYPPELLYTKEHEWIRIDESIGTIGITDHAQKELGDIVFVELPKPGDHVTAGETFGTVESVKAVSEIYSPVTGEIVAVNT
ncbi:MAG: glycine cleavage system protein H, partial [Acidobacteria bacterium]